MELIIASNNAHKIEEIKAILSSRFAPILSLQEAGIDIDVEEDGTTFEQNATKKAVAIEALRPASAILSDDSGLCVDALDGAPGVYSARFSGEAHNDDTNNEKLLRELANVTDSQRTARFVSVLALSRPGYPLMIAEGHVAGRILHQPRGNNGFGYDPLFLDPTSGKSFAEMSSDEKNIVSHRANALAALEAQLCAEERAE